MLTCVGAKSQDVGLLAVLVVGYSWAVSCMNRMQDIQEALGHILSLARKKEWKQLEEQLRLALIKYPEHILLGLVLYPQEDNAFANFLKENVHNRHHSVWKLINEFITKSILFMNPNHTENLNINQHIQQLLAFSIRTSSNSKRFFTYASQDEILLSETLIKLVFHHSRMEAIQDWHWLLKVIDTGLNKLGKQNHQLIELFRLLLEKMDADPESNCDYFCTDGRTLQDLYAIHFIEVDYTKKLFLLPVE
ncbi:hypothetical protein Ciccas_002505 [Cichlidogyrus casuarinus]|uniref:Uncharacterized protein n=1 Tax=Cichlidogyrus casuarinus TaxID=1844966 RepID=A0ABD2QH29_9PLAT